MITQSEQETTGDLIAQCRRGDTGAFRLLVEMHRQYVYRLAFRILLDVDEAEDVCQETFMRVWTHLEDYDGRARFTTWLYTIATNLARDHAKSRRRRQAVISWQDLADQGAGSVTQTDQDIADRDLARIIQGLTADLPETQRMVFVLRDLEDLDISEIAAILAISAGAVRTHLSYARRSIRNALERFEKPVGGVA